jgi:hypothetical protein
MGPFRSWGAVGSGRAHSKDFVPSNQGRSAVNGFELGERELGEQRHHVAICLWSIT